MNRVTAIATKVLHIGILLGLGYLGWQNLEHLKSLHYSAATNNALLYENLDQSVRIMHYAKPHKGPMLFCPECGDIYSRLKMEKAGKVELDSE